MVPAIGRAMANSRRAASTEVRARHRSFRGGCGCGRARKRRASSRASLSVGRFRLSTMRSSRSPCSPVAASTHLPALMGRRDARRDCGLAYWRYRQPAIASAPAAVGKVVPADRLGLFCKAADDVRRRTWHWALVRSKETAAKASLAVEESFKRVNREGL